MSTGAVVVSRPSLAGVIDTAARVALMATGAAIFIPAAIFLALDGPPEIDNWVGWLIPALLWTAGLLPSFRTQRAVVQIAAGFILVLMTLVLPDAAQWIPVTVVCFAVIAGAVFNLPTRGAVIVVVIATALDAITGYANRGELELFGVVQLAPWTGAALQLLAGGGLLIAWSSWMRNVALADLEFDAIRQTIETDQQASAAQAGAEAVARRIHETILNTLAALAMGIDPSQREQAVNACQRDLDQMDRNLQQLSDCTVRSIVDAALVTLQPSTLTCDVSIQGDRVIEAALANPLHDAIVEALRNVERHSGTTSAQVSATLDSDAITINVTDHGTGPAPLATERFGLRNSIRANMAGIHGQARLLRNRHGGTTVTLTCPARLQEEVKVPQFPILGAADTATIGRFGAAGTNIFMLIILIPVISKLPNPGLIAGANLLYIGIIFALALAWTSRARPWLNWIGIALLALPFLAASLTPLDCSASPAVQALITGGSGGATLLLLVANAALSRRLVIVTLALAGPILVTLRLPNNCQLESFLTTGVQAIYIPAIIMVLTWIDVRFEAQRNQAQANWKEYVREQAAVVRQAAIARGWTSIGPTARDLLEGIADHTVTPDDPKVRTRATAESATIRSALGLALEPGDAFGALTRRLARIAVQTGTTIDAEVVTPSARRDRLPEPVIARLEEVINQAGATTITMRSFVDDNYDEVVFAIPCSIGLKESIEFFDDVALQFETSSDATVITIRRPARDSFGNVN